MKRFLGVAIVLSFFLVASNVEAQQTAPRCNQRQIVAEKLKEKYRENVTSIGVTSAGGLIEVYESEGGETWTITVTTPNGISCLVAAGEGWKDVKPHEDDKDNLI